MQNVLHEMNSRLERLGRQDMEKVLWDQFVSDDPQSFLEQLKALEKVNCLATANVKSGAAEVTSGMEKAA